MRLATLFSSWHRSGVPSGRCINRQRGRVQILFFYFYFLFYLFLFYLIYFIFIQVFQCLSIFLCPNFPSPLLSIFPLSFLQMPLPHCFRYAARPRYWPSSLLFPSGTQSNSLLGILESSILLIYPYQLNCLR